MTVADQFNAGFRKITTMMAIPCQLRVYTYSIGSVWDDEISLNKQFNMVNYSSGDPMIPNATGSYIESGTYGGQSKYARTNGSYWLWYDVNQFVLSPSPGITTTIWVNSTGSLNGNYVNNVGASGTGTFSSGDQMTVNWISGIVMPIDTKEGTSEYLLQEQGKLKTGDLRLFYSGIITIETGSTVPKIQIGSPNGEWFSIIPAGIINYEAQGKSIFKKAYIRKLTNGSLILE